MRTLVLGDIHGAYKALVQVLERSNFDKKNDKLIFVGDVADGWHQTRGCMDINTKEYWQSDLVKELYSGENGR